jgi:hypothetical protein
MSFPSRLLATTAFVASLTSAALADVTLPAPYVSNALDAVLLPVDSNVRDAFLLSDDEEGVLVLSVAPGGVAEAYGILPGDVLMLDGSSDPVYIDEIVYYWIVSGYYVFDWDVWRDGGWISVSTEIDETWYWEGTDITTISTWESWSYESWSYEEYVVSYSEEITTTWEMSETTIIETVSSEEFSEEVTEYSEESSEEMSEEEMSEEEMSEEEMSEEEMSEEEMSEEEMSEEEMSEESAEDMSDEDEMTEEVADDMADDAGDDAAEEDAGDEGGGDEGGGEEGGGDE